MIMPVGIYGCIQNTLSFVGIDDVRWVVYLSGYRSIFMVREAEGFALFV